MKMKLSDYVAEKVCELGINQVFMITGGGAMHLNQSLGSHEKLDCLFNHHEQACAIAAEAYYRLDNRPALVNVTSGPGGTNAMTGIYGAWTDSIAMLVISGQVKRQTTVRSSGLPLRQLGDQEIDIEQLARPLTKYSVMVTDPLSIRFHLEKAFYHAVTDRPGPCWVDIPIDVQGTQIETDDLQGFTPGVDNNLMTEDQLTRVVTTVYNRLAEAKRPVIMTGTGVRLSGAHDAFLALADRLKVPVVTAWNAHDVLPDDNPWYAGRPGTVGDRAGNFAVQSADVLLVLGCRLNIRQVSYNWQSFAKNAFLIQVDIDPLELQKPTVQPDFPVVEDCGSFIRAMQKLPELQRPEHAEWLAWCKERQRRYPVVLPEYRESEKINPYCFVEALFERLEENQVIVAGNGSACVVGFQAARLKKGQRFWTNSGCAAMGYDLPAAIGACKANQNRPVVCLAGDGSIMMNLQELQTISGNRLPVKIFVINNAGYVSIAQTHHNFFNGREIGVGPASGVNFPDFEKLAMAFDLPFFHCAEYDSLQQVIDNVLNQPGPVLCEVIVDEKQPFAPKLASRQLDDGTMVSPSLEDMAPFLSDYEMRDNKIAD